MLELLKNGTKIIFSYGSSVASFREAYMDTCCPSDTASPNILYNREFDETIEHIHCGRIPDDQIQFPKINLKALSSPIKIKSCDSEELTKNNDIFTVFEFVDYIEKVYPKTTFLLH